MGTSVSVRKDGRLTVRIEQHGDSLIVRALGELDIATANSLDEEFLDSVGVRSLLAAARNSRETGDRLRIRPDSAAVRRVITVSGLERSLPLVE